MTTTKPSGLQILIRTLLVVGWVAFIVGIPAWISGNRSYNACRQFNASCSQAMTHAGIVLVIAGASVMAVGVIIFMVSREDLGEHPGTRESAPPS